MLAELRYDLAHIRFGLRLDVRMALKHHPTPLSGGDRKALTKELGKARAMAGILAAQSAEMRAKSWEFETITFSQFCVLQI